MATDADVKALDWGAAAGIVDGPTARRVSGCTSAAVGRRTGTTEHAAAEAT